MINRSNNPVKRIRGVVYVKLCNCRFMAEAVIG